MSEVGLEYVGNPHIVTIGGGTGSYTLLKELKKITSNISALVNMSDDGKSSGVLRSELGVMPPGDVRQCLVALSDEEEVRDMFAYRFDAEAGSFSGHSLGNIILAGLERQSSDFTKAVKVASSLLKITGEVIPVTLDNHTLVLDDGDETVRGEYLIGHRKLNNPDARLRLDPCAVINPEAEAAIRKADAVVIAPGNLYGSLLPALKVKGVAEGLSEARASKIMITNLLTSPGQTDGWHVADYVKKVEEYLGEGVIDYILYNTGPISAELLDKYAHKGEYPVSTTANRLGEVKAESVGMNLVSYPLSRDEQCGASGDTAIRHNAKRVGEVLIRLLDAQSVKN